MEYISNHQKTINDNTDITVQSLITMYKNINFNQNKTFYKEITKYYAAISILTNELKNVEPKSDKKILLDNILTNFCSLVHCVVLKDKKLINFVYRNIIESVIRYINDDLTSKDLESLFRTLTTYPERLSSGYVLIRKYSSQLKHIYTENCNYVHTNTLYIPTNVTNLLDYHKNEDLSEGLLDDFKILNTATIILFCVHNKNIYISLPTNQKSYILEAIPLGNRGDFQTFLHLSK